MTGKEKEGVTSYATKKVELSYEYADSIGNKDISIVHFNHIEFHKELNDQSYIVIDDSTSVNISDNVFYVTVEVVHEESIKNIEKKAPYEQPIITEDSNDDLASFEKELRS